VSYPTFDGFSLQSDNYILSEIVYRSTPTRATDTQRVARRPGVKLLAHDFGERTVRMSGHIIGSSASDLQTKIDNLHTNVTRKDEGALIIEADRSATATVTSVGVTDPHYAQDMVPFEIEFLLADPFFYGGLQTVNWSMDTSTTVSKTITISGSVFAVPTIIYDSPNSGASPTAVKSISIAYAPTAETVTWSGSTGDGFLAKDASVTFDYNHHLITTGSVEVTTSGVFSRWEPGSTNFTIIFNGTPTTGGTLSFSYQPRYL